MITFEYDTQKWNFRKYAEDVLGYKNLEKLHELPMPDPREMDIPEEHLSFSRVLYAQHGILLSERLRNSLTPEMSRLFRLFVYEFLPPRVGNVTRYQEKAVFRVHMHGGHSISGFHRDRDWGQKSDVMNLWIPFTDVWETNSIWIESEEGLNDHQPVKLAYGQALIFRGADLSHGSRANDSGSTRVSCDVRFAVG